MAIEVRAALPQLQIALSTNPSPLATRHQQTVRIVALPPFHVEQHPPLLSYEPPNDN
jgi:hypothetical protein